MSEGKNTEAKAQVDKAVRRELKKLYRVALRAATNSTHDTLPVMIAMEKYCKSKGVNLDA